MRYLLILMLLVACNQPPVKQTSEETLSLVENYGGVIVKIRNCEYIKSTVHSGHVYTHCGDCTNPIHQK